MNQLRSVAVLNILLSLSIQAVEYPATMPQAPRTYPPGEVGRLVKLGEAIMHKTDTHPLTREYVGNKLQCKSCHLSGSDGHPGTAPG